MWEGILGSFHMFLLVGRDIMERSLSLAMVEYMIRFTSFHTCWKVETPGPPGGWTDLNPNL